MTKAETLKLIDTGTEIDFVTNSEWVLEEYERYSKIGYPYLEAVTDFIIKEHSLKFPSQSRDSLHRLVYNASREAPERRKRAEGWVMATEAWLAERLGRKVEVLSESLVFGQEIKRGTVKRVGGRLFLVPLRSRTKTFGLDAVRVRDLSS